MVLPLRLRAAHCGATVLFMTALMAGVPLAAQADTAAQRQELAAALRQLDALERFVAQSVADAPLAPGERYHFDHARLAADLERMRAGIRDYLTPQRAQPRDVVELLGDYRQPADFTSASEPEATP